MKLVSYIMLMMIAFCSYSYSQKIEIFPIEFNSSGDDFNSNITKNGRSIYFTSDRKSGKQKVFIADKDNNKWDTPFLASGSVNDGDQIGAVSLTSDGQFMLFAAFEHDAKSYGRTDIYSAEKVDGRWTNVKNLGPEINSDAWDSQPMISNDGNLLFFVSDRKGGFGNTDIYMSVKVKDQWSKAVNLGNKINTEFDEMTPVIGVDNINFTFSSDRPGGVGGSDIYVSKMKSNKFSDPTNAGTPINSSDDEYYYYSMPNSQDAYVSSTRPGGSGKLDIYKVVPNPFKSDGVLLLNGIVKDIKTNKPLGANIVITDLKSKEKVADLRSDDNSGEYFVVLQQDRTYSITAEKDGYLFFSEKYDVPKSPKGTEKTKDILLSPITGGNTRLLVFFDFDKSELKDESIPELDRVVRFLIKNPLLKISIEGHTDDVGTLGYNDKLSDSRANTVRAYLTDKGIDGKRILAKGFGSKKPLINEKTEDARATNRRVEMVILD